MDGILWSTRYVVDKRMQRSCTNVMFRLALPRLVLCLGILIACLTVISGGDLGASLVGGMLGLAVGWISMRRRVGRALPAGLEMDAAFTDETMILKHRGTTTEIPLSRFTWARRYGDVLAYRLDVGKQRCFMPAALFPDDQIARMNRSQSAS